MKKLKFILCAFLFTSCLIQKEIHISVQDSSGVLIESDLHGSELRDLNPILEIPLP